MTVARVSEEQTLADLLRDGVFIDGDWVETKDQDPNGEVRLIQLADVGDGVFRDRSTRFLTMEKARELRCTFLEPGDILVARMPEPLGRACIFPGIGRPAVTVVDVCILRPNADRARPVWLVKAVNSPTFRESMQEFVRGTTRQRISRKNLGRLRLSAPSVDEQLALADLVDQVDSKCGAARDHVIAARKAIERFRQAVLTAACSGRLTADWRGVHPGGPGASDLVSQIDRARRERLGRRYKQYESAPRDEELPESWCGTTLGALVDVATGATPLRRRADYYGGDIPWVTSGAVNAGLITVASETITELALRETNTKLFPPGTLLVAMYGEGQTRGRVAELGIEAATNQAVAALLFDVASESLRPYLKVYLLRNYERVRLLSFGGVQPNLSLGVIRDTPVPLPPIAEQDEIVRRVDQLLVLADGLSQRIEGASTRIDRSSQAVLAKAFHGDLSTNRRNGDPR
jgi:type I restriction enzyme S subunit